MSLERSEILARDYHLAAPTIKCLADRLAARIFVFPDIDGEDLKILAHDSREAADLYLREVFPDK